jgi:hypothetical protein
MTKSSKAIHSDQIENNDNESQRLNNKNLLNDEQSLNNAEFININDKEFSYMALKDLINANYCILMMDFAIMAIVTFSIIYDSKFYMYILYSFLVTINWVFMHELKIKAKFSRGIYEVSKSSVIKCRITVCSKLVISSLLFIYSSLIVSSCSFNIPIYNLNACSHSFIISMVAIGTFCNLILSGLSFFYVLKVDKIRVKLNKHIGMDDNNSNGNMSNEKYHLITHKIDNDIESDNNNSKSETDGKNDVNKELS